jgi:outer membrane protein OmpA-like peptidoglycan-associated protein
MRKMITVGVCVLVLAASGCSLIRGSFGGPSGAPRTSSAAPAKPGGDMTGGRHYRTGWYDVDNNKIAWDVHRVERYRSYSVLYADLYTRPKSGTYTFGTDKTDNADFSGFSLVDAVGGRYYAALRENDQDGLVFGSRAQPSRDPFIEPDVKHPLMIYFPAVAAGTRQVTVLTPGTTGEVTGIPVMDGGKAQPSIPAETKSEPKAGRPFFYPVTPPSGKIWSQAVDLHDYVEGPSRSTTSGGDEQKIGLRTDVLFAFDKATLSSKATAVLDAAVAETRKNADPSKPPISITGFTDAKGGNAYNLGLSRRRADAVKEYVAGKLGGTYQYRTDGKGEANPVAANTKPGGGDNPAGRARNRRVEIAYRIRRATPTSTTTSSASPAPGATTAPAAFRTTDGPVIGSASKSMTGGGVKFSVHPFYRDGAYMVGVFTLRSTGGGGMSDIGAASSGWWASDGTIKAMNGASFGGVTAVDPATRDRYFEVRAGDFGTGLGQAGFVEGAYQMSLPATQDTRIFAYYPAPPANVTKVDVDVAGAGTVRNVPVL